MDVVAQRDAYEAETAAVVHLLATGVFHGEDAQDFLWLRCQQRLMSARGPFTESPFGKMAEEMRHYPAVLCLWAMGVGAILAHRENLLAKLLLEPTWKPIFGDQTPQSPVRCLNPHRRVTPTNNELRTKIYPESHHIRTVSKGAFRELEPDDAAYDAACDKLEYLASLVAMNDTVSGGQLWVGEFLLEEHRNVAAQVEKEMVRGWPLLEGGAFGGDLDRAKAARQALHEWMRGQWS